MNLRLDIIEEGRVRRRIIGFSVGACVLFFLVLCQLWYLQIVDTESLQQRSESNRLRFLPIPAPRGDILDRNGKLLASNAPSFSVAVAPQDIKNQRQLVDKLARYLNVDREEIQHKWDKGRGRAQYTSLVLASNLSRDQMEILEENSLDLDGVNVETNTVRAYPNGQLASHLLGYLGEISEGEFGSELYKGYNLGDYIGKSGIEKSWEGFLHGSDGGRHVEVDAHGRFLRIADENRASVGNTVELTIDVELQKVAEEAFGDRAGAAVALDVNSGEVLAFVSTPDFDPALFTGPVAPAKWKEYLEDPRHPLENKALRGMYPPGSTFKIITAIAGLEEGLIDAHTSIDCPGYFRLGNSTFRCWRKRGHGRVELKKAIRESCDVYFYKLAERLGVNRIASYASRCGLGAPLGVGLDNEKGGVIPTEEWKRKRFGQKWFKGETISVGIGQGYVLTTPIQLASMIATVANGGVLYQPRLVRRICDSNGKVLREFPSRVIRKTGIQPETYRLVREGLFAVVNEPQGTGGMARLSEVAVAGKTGSSQVVKLQHDKGEVPYQFRDHALFVAFAPYQKPEIAVAVLVEHGVHGGSAAAPIAGRMLRAYFEGKGVIRKPEAKPAGPGADGGITRAAGTPPGNDEPQGPD
jgi:penicillin-binding protein 2